MREKLGSELMRAASRFAIIGVVGGMTAACSTDRFASTPFSNPFSSGSAEPNRTGSLAAEPEAAPAMPRSTVDSQPLAPIRPITSAPAPPPSTYASPAPHATAARPRTASGAAGWSTTGGTTVIVGPGETLTTLTSRYGVPAEAILSSNGLKPGDVSAGKRVVIPVYSATDGGSAAAPARRAEVAPAPAPVRFNAPPAPAQAAPRVVASQKIDVRKEPPRTVAEAAPPKSQLRPGKPVVAKAPEPPKEVAKPVARVAEAKKEVAKAAPAPKVVAKAPEKVEAKPAKVARAPEKEVLLPARKVASVEPVKPAKVEAPAKVAASPKAERAPIREPESTASIAPAAPLASAAPAAPAAPAASAGSSADFRWPARGRVITGFGGGGGNEGINIAVPEGTPVKAAGDGVVAYAGSEVKGYGNLVLIRHDNGYVSAYANNGNIDVKRGQRVSRGQAIAKSGQTGNVTSPQLHFEIRKGSTPVDPMKYLASAD